MTERPRVAVFKLASCDGCQLTLLDCEDELLAVAGAVDLVQFPEASSRMLPGPYDLTLVEGSITTPHDAERIRRIRADSKVLVTIGACATAGGIQALRNHADVAAWTRLVYARPEYVETLATSTPVSAHVPVDFELRGCPVDKGQLLEVLTAFLHGRRPAIPTHAVCTTCKLEGVPCVVVTRGEPCLGPVTQAGCGALCPTYGRGCYGCFGPSKGARPPALSAVLTALGVDDVGLQRVWSTFHTASPAFEDERRRLREAP